MSSDAADRGESGNRNDLIIDNGFPALNTFRRPRPTTTPGGSKPEAAGAEESACSSSSSIAKEAQNESLGEEGGGKEGQDPIPRYAFASFPSSLSIPSSSSSGDDSLLPSIVADCDRAFAARDKETEEDTYSSGATFFIPAGFHPRCALEALALDVFRAHTTGLDVGRHYDLERSGAEWWTLILDSSEGDDNEKAKAEEKEKEGSAKKGDDEGHGEADTDDDDDDGEDVLGMHFDADYGLEAQLPNYLLHPRVSTVTYLSDCGLPTLILDKKSPPPTDAQKSSLNGPIARGYLSHPRFGKHVAFDGRLLHGAPGAFFPAAAGDLGGGGDGGEERDGSSGGDGGGDAKRRKLDESGKAAAGDNDAAAAAGSASSPGGKKRVTFLVNVWLNHCPIDADLLDDEDVQAMTTPWEGDGAGGDDAAPAAAAAGEKETSAAAAGSKKRGGGGGNGYVRPFHFALPNVDSPPKLQAVELVVGGGPGGEEGPAAGTEETVLCDRRVDVCFGPTVEACRRASARAAACEAGGEGRRFSTLVPGR